MPKETEAKRERVRSPNYPAMSLPEAVQQIQKLFAKISQHPAPRESVATGLGYSGLHGASATAISALLKYGLLDRDGEDYKIGERAMKIIAPHSPAEKAEALKAAARDPALFAELIDHFKGDVPNDDLLRSYLIRKGFATAAVPQVIEAFRETMELVTRDGNVYSPDEKPSEGSDMSGELQREQTKTPPAPLKLATGERELTTGLLSKNASFRLVVSGDVGVKEIERLIAKLQLDKEILADPEGGSGTSA
jgi:hypothetical protein